MAQIRCGHCPQRHATVDEVRACFDEEAQAKAEYEAEMYAERAMMAYLEGGWDKTGEYSYDGPVW